MCHVLCTPSQCSCAWCLRRGRWRGRCGDIRIGRPPIVQTASSFSGHYSLRLLSRWTWLHKGSLLLCEFPFWLSRRILYQGFFQTCTLPWYSWLCGTVWHACMRSGRCVQCRSLLWTGHHHRHLHHLSLVARLHWNVLPSSISALDCLHQEQHREKSLYFLLTFQQLTINWCSTSSWSALI